jgi:hypothetical protein
MITYAYWAGLVLLAGLLLGLLGGKANKWPAALALAATWKDDNLWVENYDPATNTCHFREYSRGNLLQGTVTIQNCNPMLRGSAAERMPSR